MSSTTRNYASINGIMYMAVAFDKAGKVVRSAGPYSTPGAAAGQRNWLLGQQRVAAVDVLESVKVDWGSANNGKYRKTKPKLNLETED